MKFRSIFIKIVTENDETDEKRGQFRAIFLLRFFVKSVAEFLENSEIGAIPKVQNCVRLVDL